MNLIRKIIYIIFAATVIAVIILGILYNKAVHNLYVYDNNFKALNLENAELEKEVIAYKFNAEQLEYINDSIIKDLNATRKELGIKDKQLKQLQSIKSEVVIKDNVYFKDTVFRDNFIKLDTLLGNKWYKIKLKLEYPNKIGINTSYKSELSVIAYTSKEILGTPKKCFIGRWFQKKHNIIRVAVSDNNPYSEIKEKKFVIIE